MRKTFRRRLYPLPAYNYRVQVDETVMSFSDVSGISADFDKVTYRTGLSTWEGEAITTFNFGSFISVTLKRGVILGQESDGIVRLAESRRPQDAAGELVR